jgi:CRP-like cAMP-binding protein
MRRTFPDEYKPWLKDILAGIPEVVTRPLLDAGTVSEIDEGDRISDFHGSVVRVQEGMVKLAVTAEGRNLTVGLYGPGNTICAPLYHDWEEGLYFIEAQEEAEINVLPRAAVLQAMEQSPTFSQAVLRQVSWDTWQLMNIIHMLAFYTLPQRVAQVLINLETMFGRPDPKGGIRLGLRFTQEELAELAGARRETLSTVLQEFREEDILDLRYARIDIRNPDALHQVAAVEPLPFIKQSRA